MLFPYKYVPHDIEKLQEYMDHLFLNVWCSADGEYDIEKLHPDLKEIALEIYYDDKIEKDHLYGPIKEIYDLFLKISKGQREALKKWYSNNNSIEDLCCNNDGCKPIKYKTLKQLFAELSPKLEKFFKSLFTEVIHLKSVWSRIGKIDEHYIEFMKENDEGKCPFCGINNIKGQYQSRRDAYDHYLPKDIYPFNSINFKNLAPICNECNSSYKTVKDPLLDIPTGKRRKAFYPFTEVIEPAELSIEFKSKDTNSLQPQDIDIKITSDTHQEEVDTWMDVFGIEERYIATCLAKYYGKSWYTQATEGYERAKAQLGANFTKETWINYILTDAETDLYGDANFIKVAFIKGWQKAKVL